MENELIGFNSLTRHFFLGLWALTNFKYKLLTYVESRGYISVQETS